MMRSKRKKENKITERALYASLLSMVLCCVMLFETTYAWFTQTITSQVAVIKTGEMSAELVVYDEEKKEYIKADADNHLIFKEYDITTKTTGDSTVFEPGKSYRLPAIYVQNTGEIDLKYTVEVNIIGATTVKSGTEDTVAIVNEDGSSHTINLCDVITFTAFVGEDTSEPIALTSDENSESSDSNNSDAGNVSNIITGTLEAVAVDTTEEMVALNATEKAVSVSEPIIIQAAMNPDATSDYQNLQLSGIQIIVNATQMIATEENTENSTENSTEQVSTTE